MSWVPRIRRSRLVGFTACLGLAALSVMALSSILSAPPPPLVGNLIEGMDEQQATAALGVPPSAIHVAADITLPKDDPRPPYSVKVVNADHALCMGQISDVSLSFYLRQLHTVACYPKDVDAMVDALIAANLLSTRGRDFSVTRGGVAINSHLIDGRWCVSFVSERLSKKERRWNLRYS